MVHRVSWMAGLYDKIKNKFFILFYNPRGVVKPADAAYESKYLSFIFYRNPDFFF